MDLRVYSSGTNILKSHTTTPQNLACRFDESALLSSHPPAPPLPIFPAFSPQLLPWPGPSPLKFKSICLRPTGPMPECAHSELYTQRRLMLCCCRAFAGPCTLCRQPHNDVPWCEIHLMCLMTSANRHVRTNSAHTDCIPASKLSSTKKKAAKGIATQLGFAP